MQFSEKEVEDLIFKDVKENYGETLCEKGLVLPFQLKSFNHKIKLNVKWCRQLDIPPYGTLDIAGFYRYRGILYVDLIELKACPIESAHFDQVFRYKKGIEVYIRQTFKHVLFEINCILIGAGYNTGNYIQNNSEITVCEYTFGLDGFSFINHKPFTSWTLTDDDHCTFRKIQPPQRVRIKPGVHNGKTLY